MSNYHHAAYTLDPDKQIEEDPEKVPPAVGHDEDMAEKVLQGRKEHREAAEEERKQATERAQEWDERDPKPKPSELLQEKGFEPAPERDESEPAPGSEDASEASPKARA